MSNPVTFVAAVPRRLFPKFRAFWRARRRFLVPAFVVLGAFAILEWIFEHSKAGHHLSRDVLLIVRHHLRLPAGVTRPPIVVVDLSHSTNLLPTVETSSTGARSEKAFTPRRELLELIRSLTRHGPLAIGLDIDFSPEDEGDGVMAADTAEFLEACLANPVPVYLGVRRTEALGPRGWLYSERYAGLAAGITRPPDLVETMFLGSRIPRDDGTRPLKSMSDCLATHREWKREPKPWWALTEVFHTVRPAPNHPGFEVDEFYLDFSPLRALMEERVVDATPEGIDRAEREERARHGLGKFSGRIVLVGDASMTDGARVFDAAPVPVSPLVVPGTYLHACGAWSLMKENHLRKVRSWVSVAATVLASVLVLFGIHWLCWRQAERGPTTPIPLIIVWTAVYVVLVCLLTVGLASYRVLWLGGFAAILFAVIHTLIHIVIESTHWRALRRNLAAVATDLVLAPKHDATPTHPRTEPGDRGSTSRPADPGSH